MTWQPLGECKAVERVLCPLLCSDALQCVLFNLFMCDASVHYKNLWGVEQKKKKKIRKLYSSIEVGLFSRLTCNTRPLSFTVIVYPTLPGCVCPHNPIIPDKIFHYLEYFQCCPGQSSFGPFFFFFFFHCSSNLCCSALAASSICKVKDCTEVGFPYWAKWLVIQWSYGRCCQRGVIAVTLMAHLSILFRC